MMKKLFFLGLIALVTLSFVLVHAQDEELGEDPMNELMPPSDGYGDSYGEPAGGPPPAEVKEFDSWAEIETYINEDEMEPAVIGYFDAENDDDITAFKDVSTSFLIF